MENAAHAHMIIKLFISYIVDMKRSLSRKKCQLAATASSMIPSTPTEATPPGINNTALNCYANSTFQCLLNHPGFLDIARNIVQEHEINKCGECQKIGKVNYFECIILKKY